MIQLLNNAMSDGSRHFFSMPEGYPWEPFRDYLAKLPDIFITDFSTDNITEVWINFSYERHSFTINNQFGEYWFFVSDRNCPDFVLQKIAEYCTAFPRRTM